MKKTVKITAIIALAFITTIFAACKQEQKEQENAENIKELKSELKDLNLAIENLVKTEDETFKEEAFKIIDNFNEKITIFENNLKEDGGELDTRTQQSLSELKSSIKGIEAKLVQMDEQNQEKLTEIQSELKHDFTEFGNSIKNFFNDNI